MTTEQSQINETLALAHEILCLIEQFDVHTDTELAALKTVKTIIKAESIGKRRLLENE